MMTEGESYSDLGGQLPDETQRELGLRKIPEVRARLAETLCPSCGHSRHRDVCGHSIAPRGEVCGCNEHENEGESNG